jgi:hypothetical protein
VEVIDVAVVGAGPFGLSVAAHLAGRTRVRTFGEPMRTWRRLMPPDMLLRSDWQHTNLAAPEAAGTLDRFVSETGERRQEPTPLALFLRYADWFRERFVRESDAADVTRLDAADGGFRLQTAAGDELQAASVVLAVGVTPFPNVPAAFRGVDDARIAFAIQDGGGARFAGRRVAVVGAGQNGLESAVLAARAGAASVQILVRSRVRWYTPREPSQPRGPLGRRLYRLAYPVVGFGPPPLNRVVFHPDLYARLPFGARARINARLLRPGGSPWIRGEVDGRIPVREGVEVTRVQNGAGGLRLGLSSGGDVEVDDVVLATGYRFDLDRLSFLSPELRAGIACEHGWPVLDRLLRSTRPGVLFAGYPCEARFGPLTRFVEGTRFAAERVHRALS